MYDVLCEYLCENVKVRLYNAKKVQRLFLDWFLIFTLNVTLHKIE